MSLFSEIEKTIERGFQRFTERIVKRDFDCGFRAVIAVQRAVHA